MAGGEGSRLFPLTKDRAKPAVAFGGKYRLIDFVLNNFINSNMYSIYVLTQFKSQSLTEHIQESWRLSSILRDHFILPVPAQKRTGGDWYQGTADAIFQNINLIQDREYDLVAIFGADHIYSMDIRKMVDFHLQKGADVTISSIPFPVQTANDLGIIEVNSSERVIGDIRGRTAARTSAWAEEAARSEVPKTSIAAVGAYGRASHGWSRTAVISADRHRRVSALR